MVQESVSAVSPSVPRCTDTSSVEEVQRRLMGAEPSVHVTSRSVIPFTESEDELEREDAVTYAQIDFAERLDQYLLNKFGTIEAYNKYMKYFKTVHETSVREDLDPMGLDTLLIVETTVRIRRKTPEELFEQGIPPLT